MKERGGEEGRNILVISACRFQACGESALNKTTQRRTDMTSGSEEVNRAQIVCLLIECAKLCNMHPTGGAVL